MQRAKVLGEVWATKKVDGLKGFKLLLVCPYKVEKDKRNYYIPESQLIVAVDVLDSRVGQDVMLVYGSGARNVLDNQDLPIEAAIAGVIDD